MDDLSRIAFSVEQLRKDLDQVLLIVRDGDSRPALLNRVQTLEKDVGDLVATDGELKASLATILSTQRKLVFNHNEQKRLLKELTQRYNYQVELSSKKRVKWSEILISAITAIVVGIILNYTVSHSIVEKPGETHLVVPEFSHK